jgi:hypothetical protein
VPSEPRQPLTDAQKVVRWRFKEARSAGLTRVEARLYAESEQDVSILRLLVAHGATAQQIAKVLL